MFLTTKNNGWLKPTAILSESDGPTGRSLISVFNKAIDSPAHDWSVGSISLDVVGCIFEGNSHYTSIIDFDGGDPGLAHLTIRDCCFRNNSLSQFDYDGDGDGDGDINSWWAAPVLVGGDDRRRRPVSSEQTDIISLSKTSITATNIFVKEDEGYLFSASDNLGGGGGGNAVCGIHPKFVMDSSLPPEDSTGCVTYFSDGVEDQVCGVV